MAGIAERGFSVDLNLNKNELLNAVIHTALTAGAPGSPTEGQVYYSTDDNTVYVWTGAAWLDLGTQDSGLATDGDYGDITVSGTGTVWNIDAGVVGTTELADDSVTYPKIQNVVNNNVFLGNNQGAGAIVDELTGTEATAMLDLFATGATTKGLVVGSNGGGSGVFLNGLGNWTTPAGGFADFDAGADVGADITIDTGDLLQITTSIGVPTTGPIETTISSATVTKTIDFKIDFIDDDTLATATAVNIPSAESVKAYIDSSVSGALVYKGGFDPTAAAGAGIPNLNTLTSVKGDTYTVTAAGTYDFTTGTDPVLEIGDMLIAEADGVLSDGDSWTIVNKNIPEIVDASTTAKGIVELATTAEATTGTDTVRAITPDALEDKTYGTFTGTTITDNSVLKTALQELETAVEAAGSPEVNASETVKGIVEEATDAETAAGTATGATGAKLFVTPAKLQTELGTVGVNGSITRRFSATTAASTVTTVTHNFGTRFVQVQIFKTTSPWNQVEAQVELDTINTVVVTFNTATTAGEYTILVIG